MEKGFGHEIISRSEEDEVMPTPSFERHEGQGLERYGERMPTVKWAIEKRLEDLHSRRSKVEYLRRALTHPKLYSDEVRDALMDVLDSIAEENKMDETVAEIWEDLHEDDRASRAFERAAEFRTSIGQKTGGEALLHLKNHEYSQAAEKFQEAGWFVSAAIAWEKDGNVNRARENYEKAAMECENEWPPFHIIRYWLKAGRQEKADEIVKKIEEFAKRGGLFGLEDAATANEIVGNKENAHDLYIKAAEDYALNKQGGDSGQPYSSARMWQEAGEYKKAAEAFEKLYFFYEAADAWRSAGDATKAKECDEKFTAQLTNNRSSRWFMEHEVASKQERTGKILKAKRLRSRIRKIRDKE